MGSGRHRFRHAALQRGVEPQPGRQRVAGAAEVLRAVELCESAFGISIWQRRAVGKFAIAQHDHSAERDVGRERVVEVAVWVWWEADAREEVPELTHLRCGERGRRALQVRERAVERFDVRTIAAPVKWLVPDDVLHGLGDHHTFHRVKRVRDERALMIDHRAGEFACWIAEIPAEPVHAGIHMTRRARCLAEAGGAPRVVEMTATGGDFERRGIEQADDGLNLMAGGIHHGEARREAVIDVQASANLIEGEAARTFADFDGWLRKSRAVGVDGDDIARTHSRNVAARAIGTPRHGARVADGFGAFAGRDGRRRVVEVRIQIGDGLREVQRIDHRQFHADENAIQVRFEANFIARICAGDGDVACGRIGLHGHANVHQAARVADRERCGVDDGEIAVR